jgi:hypothetical protein
MRIEDSNGDYKEQDKIEEFEKILK